MLLEKQEEFIYRLKLAVAILKSFRANRYAFALDCPSRKVGESECGLCIIIPRHKSRINLAHLWHLLKFEIKAYHRQYGFR